MLVSHRKKKILWFLSASKSIMALFFNHSRKREAIKKKRNIRTCSQSVRSCLNIKDLSTRTVSSHCLRSPWQNNVTHSMLLKWVYLIWKLNQHLSSGPRWGQTVPREGAEGCKQQVSKSRPLLSSCFLARAHSPFPEISERKVGPQGEGTCVFRCVNRWASRV